MNGYAVARTTRSQPWGAGILLIAATGWGQQRDRDAASDAGFDLHMVKPIDFGVLGATIHGWPGADKTTA